MFANISIIKKAMIIFITSLMSAILLGCNFGYHNDRLRVYFTPDFLIELALASDFTSPDDVRINFDRVFPFERFHDMGVSVDKVTISTVHDRIFYQIARVLQGNPSPGWSMTSPFNIEEIILSLTLFFNPSNIQTRRNYRILEDSCIVRWVFRIEVSQFDT